MMPLFLRIFRLIAQPFGRWTSLCLLSGLISGIYLVSFCHQSYALLGMSGPVTNGLGAAMVLALVASVRGSNRRDGGVSPWISFAIGQFGLALAAAACPWLLAVIAWGASGTGDNVWTSPVATSVFAFLTGGVLLGIPVFLIASLPRWLHHCDAHDRPGELVPPTRQPALADQVPRTHVYFLIGTGLGLWLAGIGHFCCLFHVLPASSWRLYVLADAADGFSSWTTIRRWSKRSPRSCPSTASRWTARATALRRFGPS